MRIGPSTVLHSESYHKNFGQMDITKSYEKLFELLWYTRLPCFDVKGITSKERDEMSVIKRCYWRSKVVDCASVFVTRSTDRGMCCSFNQVPSYCHDSCHLCNPEYLFLCICLLKGQKVTFLVLRQHFINGRPWKMVDRTNNLQTIVLTIWCV